MQLGRPCPSNRCALLPQPLRVSVCYWKEKVPGTYGSPAGFPCFLSLSTSQTPHDIYGLPASEYPGMVKVSTAGNAHTHVDTCRGTLHMHRRGDPHMCTSAAHTCTCVLTNTPLVAHTQLGLSVM